MRTKLTLTNVLLGVVVLLVALQGVSWYLLTKVQAELDNTRDSIQLALNDVDSNNQQQALSPIPGTDRLYLPEFNLTIPRTQTSSSLRYTATQGAPSGETVDEIRLTSSFMTDHTTHVKSCSDMVRLKLEAKPNPYSPEQPLYATVDLADGRTLQVYTSTTDECESAWLMVSPEDLAKAFKTAQTYTTP